MSASIRPITALPIIGLVAMLMLSGCIQRDREEHVERIESAVPDQQPFNVRMPRTVGVDQARRMLETDDEIVLVDVRDGRAWSKSIIKGAIHLPEELVASNALREFPDLDRRMLLYSIPGRGSIKAATTLRELGYRNVGRLHGTWEEWQQAGLPIGVPKDESRFRFPAEQQDEKMVDKDAMLTPAELPFPSEAEPIPLAAPASEQEAELEAPDAVPDSPVPDMQGQGIEA